MWMEGRGNVGPCRLQLLDGMPTPIRLQLLDVISTCLVRSPDAAKRGKARKSGKWVGGSVVGADCLRKVHTCTVWPVKYIIPTYRPSTSSPPVLALWALRGVADLHTRDPHQSHRQP